MSTPDEPGDPNGSRFNLDTIWEQFKAGIESPEFRKFFNRDPDRRPPAEAGVVVAPSDGVLEVLDADGAVLKTKIGYLDVHVQRVPLAGQLLRLSFSGSGHIKTGDPEHVRNYKATVEIASSYGTYALEMITGFSVRRLQVFAEPDDLLDTGARLGRILFGSTSILRLPAGARLCVASGDRGVGGETVVARFA